MIKDNLIETLNTIPENVQLVAVSKTKPNEDLMEAYHAGQRVFGENKVQELTIKYEELPTDIQWHMIGHLQRNKVKYIAPFVSMIHAVDSVRLLKEINKQAKKNDRVINCLLQFHIAEESTKFGLDLDEAHELLSSDEFKAMENISICGVMGMATFTDNEEQVRREFGELKKIFNDLKENFFKTNDSFKEISMGMSGDYKIAIEEGSTMVRIGSTIFGARNY
jgi:pyridoxal phosphate enzyme (YggS family)